ncbi:hypothetical protein D3C85_1594240 [compost metagenome]
MFEGTEHIMMHRRPGCEPGIIIIFGVTPGRIGIPGNHIQYFGQLAVIHAVNIVHIRRYRQLWVIIAHRINLVLAEINRRLAYEAAPVEVKAVNLCLSVRGRGLHLIP